MAHEAVRFYAQRSFDILVVMLSRTAARGLRHRATVARSSVRIFSATSGEDLPPPSPDDERYKFKSDDVCNPVAEYNTDNLNDFAYPTTFPSPWKVEHWKRVYGEIKDGETEEEFRRRVPNMWSPESRAGEVVDVPYLHRWFEFNHGPGMWQHTFFEPGMVKAAPDYDPDWTPLGSKSARKKKEDEL